MTETFPTAVLEVPGIVAADVTRTSSATPGYQSTSLLLRSTFATIEAETLSAIMVAVRDTHSYSNFSTWRITLRIIVEGDTECVPLEAAAKQIDLPAYVGKGAGGCEFLHIDDEGLVDWSPSD